MRKTTSMLAVAVTLSLVSACGDGGGAGPEEEAGFVDLTGLFNGKATTAGGGTLIASLNSIQTGPQVDATLQAGTVMGGFTLTFSAPNLTGAGTTSVHCDDGSMVTDDHATLDLDVSADLSSLTGTFQAMLCANAGRGGGSELVNWTLTLSR